MHGESSERVGGWTKLPLSKIVNFFVKGKKKMKQLAFFMNLSRLSRKNYLVIVRPILPMRITLFIFTDYDISTLSKKV
jgi:hypothetical protein